MIDLAIDNTGMVGIGTASPTSRLTLNGSLARNIVTITTSTYTATGADTHLIINCACGTTITLPPAASYPGRELTIRTTTANNTISASSNVVQLAGGAPTPGVLSGGAGKWTMLVSDGTNWQKQMAN